MILANRTYQTAEEATQDALDLGCYVQRSVTTTEARTPSRVWVTLERAHDLFVWRLTDD